MKIVEYLDRKGRSPFAAWFESLDAQAAAKVTVAIARIGQGNLANIKSVGGGVAEWRIQWGPGCRLYLGREGDELIILLAGGTKRRQQADIKAAQAYWADYKKRKQEAG